MAYYYAIVVVSMLAFSISAGQALDDRRLKTTLYIKQTPAQDQRGVATDTVVINWRIKDGPDDAANTIGHAEGLTVHANLAKNFWVTIIDMVFESGSFAGSTLEVMGLHGSMNDGEGQWSVMGGTGDLKMARGIIYYTIIQEDSASRTFKIRIDVYYTSTLTSPPPPGLIP